MEAKKLPEDNELAPAVKEAHEKLEKADTKNSFVFMGAFYTLLVLSLLVIVTTPKQYIGAAIVLCVGVSGILLSIVKVLTENEVNENRDALKASLNASYGEQQVKEWSQDIAQKGNDALKAKASMVGLAIIGLVLIAGAGWLLMTFLGAIGSAPAWVGAVLLILYMFPPGGRRRGDQD